MRATLSRSTVPPFVTMRTSFRRVARGRRASRSPVQGVQSPGGSPAVTSSVDVRGRPPRRRRRPAARSALRPRRPCSRGSAWPPWRLSTSTPMGCIRAWWRRRRGPAWKTRPRFGSGATTPLPGHRPGVEPGLERAVAQRHARPAEEARPSCAGALAGPRAPAGAGSLLGAGGVRGSPRPEGPAPRRRRGRPPAALPLPPPACARTRRRAALRLSRASRHLRASSV